MYLEFFLCDSITENVNLHVLLFKTRHLKPVTTWHQLQGSIVRGYIFINKLKNSCPKCPNDFLDFKLSFKFLFPNHYQAQKRRQKWVPSSVEPANQDFEDKKIHLGSKESRSH